MGCKIKRKELINQVRLRAQLVLLPQKQSLEDDIVPLLLWFNGDW